jgi:hypothetical protein
MEPLRRRRPARSPQTRRPESSSGDPSRRCDEPVPRKIIEVLRTIDEAPDYGVWPSGRSMMVKSHHVIPPTDQDPAPQ